VRLYEAVVCRLHLRPHLERGHARARLVRHDYSGDLRGRLPPRRSALEDQRGLFCRFATFLPGHLLDATPGAPMNVNPNAMERVAVGLVGHVKA